MGPFNMPWMTFSAFIVIGASIAISIIWAINDIRKESGGDRAGEGRG